MSELTVQLQAAQQSLSEKIREVEERLKKVFIDSYTMPTDNLLPMQCKKMTLGFDGAKLQVGLYPREGEVILRTVNLDEIGESLQVILVGNLPDFVRRYIEFCAIPARIEALKKSNQTLDQIVADIASGAFKNA